MYTDETLAYAVVIEAHIVDCAFCSPWAAAFEVVVLGEVAPDGVPADVAGGAVVAGFYMVEDIAQQCCVVADTCSQAVDFNLDGVAFGSA